MDSQMILFVVLPIVLVSLGALGSTVFVIDYIRTANFSIKFARMVIALNIGIAGVLWISLVHRVVELQDHHRLYITIPLFTVIDFCLWYQWYLLRKGRREQKRD